MIKVTFDGKLDEIAPAVKSLFSECVVHGIRIGGTPGSGMRKHVTLLLETHSNPHRDAASARWLQEWFDKFDNEPNPLAYDLSPKQWEGLRTLSRQAYRLNLKIGEPLVRKGLAKRSGPLQPFVITDAGRKLVELRGELEGEVIE